MPLNWPDTERDLFGENLNQGHHDLHTRDAFSDAGLADILDRFPREHLGIYAFPHLTSGISKPSHGTADGVPGKHLLEAVKQGHIWLNLRGASHHLDDIATMETEVFSALDAASGKRSFKRDVGLLISSPNVHVNYHLDITMVTLIQIRGEKRVWLYPTEDAFASPEAIEAIALRECEEDVAYDPAFDEAATQITLTPGKMITWPQFAPHRVQNGNMLNVSLSCEFLTWPAWVRANEVYANGVLRRRAGWAPNYVKDLTPASFAKAGLSRLIKASHNVPTSPPTTATFQIDSASAGGVRAL
ncbi:MAG: hypothetical protein AAF216_04645 [Pseudomonadota bacterium]